MTLIKYINHSNTNNQIQSIKHILINTLINTINQQSYLIKYKQSKSINAIQSTHQLYLINQHNQQSYLINTTQSTQSLSVNKLKKHII